MKKVNVNRVVTGAMLNGGTKLSSLNLTHRTVAVYGTLRNGMHNNGLMQGLQYLGTLRLMGYKMYTMQPVDSEGNRSVPYVVCTGDRSDSIMVELWSGAHAGGMWGYILKRLDALECHPTWYTRKLIYPCRFENGPLPVSPVRVWIYLFEDAVFKEYQEEGLCKPVPSGDYCRPEGEASLAESRGTLAGTSLSSRAAAVNRQAWHYSAEKRSIQFFKDTDKAIKAGGSS